MWEAILLSAQLLILGIVSWGAYRYIKLIKHIDYYYSKLKKKMNCDELIDQLLESEKHESKESPNITVTSTTEASPTAKCRERLAALAVGGQSKQYLGQTFTVENIDNMTDAEVEKLYNRYEARLGAAMTKTLGTAVLQLYALAASAFLPIPVENQSKLVEDLEGDPFVGHALSTATCELYHRYGMFLAPLTAALTTAKHCQFGHMYQSNISEDIDDVRPGTSCRSGNSRESDCTKGTVASTDEKP